MHDLQYNSYTNLINGRQIQVAAADRPITWVLAIVHHQTLLSDIEKSKEQKFTNRQSMLLWYIWTSSELINVW